MQLPQVVLARLNNSPELRETLQAAEPNDRIEEPVLLVFNSEYSPVTQYGGRANSVLTAQEAQAFLAKQDSALADDYKTIAKTGVDMLSELGSTPAVVVQGTARQIYEALLKECVKSAHLESEALQDLGLPDGQPRVTQVNDEQLRKLFESTLAAGRGAA